MLKKWVFQGELLISASAVGFYGDRNDETLDENAAVGDLFLSEVVKKWEEATEKEKNAEIRVVNARMGIVLSPKGGALSLMLPVFRLGLGGRLGNGEQFISWIALSDVLRAYHFGVEHEEVQGPVNFCAPFPEKNKNFTKILAKKLNRPAFFHVPSFLIKLFIRQQGKELLLASAKVFPKKLEKAGFLFENQKLQQAFDTLL
ncbi:MAG: TIGR01777 family protein [Deltaproteobacteria bacterium CG11_big_fil_rev_8_21_14_0_20_42_23]|nr:MAG: TIGR01777 family protein [Deltaproteobacteria bacterium CG11_big_fil_rev_8_21_14_0_20_42_23]